MNDEKLDSSQLYLPTRRQAIKGYHCSQAARYPIKVITTLYWALFTAF